MKHKIKCVAVSEMWSSYEALKNELKAIGLNVVKIKVSVYISGFWSNHARMVVWDDAKEGGVE